MSKHITNKDVNGVKMPWNNELGGPHVEMPEQKDLRGGAQPEPAKEDEKEKPKTKGDKKLSKVDAMAQDITEIRDEIEELKDPGKKESEPETQAVEVTTDVTPELVSEPIEEKPVVENFDPVVLPITSETAHGE